MNPLIDPAMVRCIRETGNTSENLPDRLETLEKHGFAFDRPAENVVVTGCQILPGLPHVIEAMTRIFDRAGFSYTFLSREYCCGNNLYRPAIKARDEQAMEECRNLSREFVHRNLEAAKQLGARRLVIFCSPCYPIYKHAIKDFEIVFYPRAIAECLQPMASDRSIDYYAGCYRLHKKFAPVKMDLKSANEVFEKFQGLSVHRISAPQCCYKPEGAAHMMGGVQTGIMVHVCTGCYVQALVNKPQDRDFALQMLPEFVEACLTESS